MLILRSTRMIFPDGARAAALHIENGVITRIAAHDTEDLTGAALFDAGDLVVSPGLVDTHVHVNEPGRSAWEGFDTATRAAAAGGVTTIVDMPLNSIPATTSVAALCAKRDAALMQCHVDVAFWGGVVPGNAGELDALVDAGVRGFKCFLVPSGVDEFPAVAQADLREALPIIARRRVPLLVHAELPERLVIPTHQALRLGGTQNRAPRSGQAHPTFQPHDTCPTYPTYPTYQSYQTYLATRPPAAEVEAINLVARLAAEFDARVHIVHVSSAEGVAAIAAAKAASVPITAETCPHYLTFSADAIADGATEFKCAPPIRDAAHRDAIWRGLADGTLDLIATDHSPAPPVLKRPNGVGDFIAAWGGIASLELSLPAVWSGIRARSDDAHGFSQASSGATEAAQFTRLARWLSEAPAALAGLGRRKGRIAAGLDADLVVWDPDADTPVDPSQLQQRHKLTPYAGLTLAGRIETTFVGGERVWDRGRLTRAYGGRLL
jgi:allantoinase